MTTGRFFVFDVSTKELDEEINRLIGERSKKTFFSKKTGAFKSGGVSQLIGEAFENIIERSFFKPGQARKNSDRSGEGDFVADFSTISSRNLIDFYKKVKQLTNSSPMTKPLLPEIKDDIFQTAEIKATQFNLASSKNRQGETFKGSNKIKIGSVIIGESGVQGARYQEVVKAVGKVQNLTKRKDIISFIMNNADTVADKEFRKLVIEALDPENTFIKKAEVLFLPITFKTGTNRIKTMGVAVNTRGLITHKDLSLSIEKKYGDDDEEAEEDNKKRIITGMAFKIEINTTALTRILKDLTTDLETDISKIDFSSGLRKTIAKNPNFISNLLSGGKDGKTAITLGLVDQTKLKNIIINKFKG